MTCNPQLSAWLKAMHAAVHTYKLQLPDVVLSLSGVRALGLRGHGS